MVIRNFLFHRVSDDTDTLWPPMKPPLFSEIIKYLTRHYSIVPLEYYLRDAAAFPTNRKIATVLFDDGYKDNIEVAAPILKKYNCPASFYIVSECIDKNIPTWTYVLDHIFQQSKKQKVELSYDFIPGKFKSFDLRVNGELNPLIRQFKPWLKSTANSRRNLIVQSLVHQCDDVKVPDNKMMNWNDIRQLDNEGFIIGSHSHTHPMLASIEDETEIANELRISGQRIEQEIKKFPLTISYPIGSVDERVMKLSVEEGYKYGLATEQRFFKTEKDNRFKIPRVELYQEPWLKVRMRIGGMYATIKKMAGRS